MRQIYLLVIDMARIAWINLETNICDNVSLDERPVSEIKIDNYLMVSLEEVGFGGIGWVWDGEKLINPNTPNLDQPQPVANGTQTI